MCAATLAISFDSLEAVREISEQEQKALKEAGKKYLELKSQAQEKAYK